MSKKADLDISVLADGVVDYFWNSSSPPVEVDHSARRGAANRLILSIAPHISNLSQEDAYSKIMSLLEEDHRFRATIEDKIESAISRFEEHYIKFGGKSALFVYCLLLCLGSDNDNRIYKAKASLINWYAEGRRIDGSLVDGGGVKAWWPFEWFSSNFDAIAASIIASVIFTTSTVTLSKIWKAFFQSYEPVRRSCNPFPEPVLRGKSPNQTMEEFRDSLDESGLIDQFLYLFRLSNDELRELIEDWSQAFQWFQGTLKSNEKSFLSALLDRPVVWRAKIKESNALRERKVLRLIEPNPNELWLSLYPRIFEDEN